VAKGSKLLRSSVVFTYYQRKLKCFAQEQDSEHFLRLVSETINAIERKLSDNYMEGLLVSEQWVKWEPVQDMSSSYYIDSVSDSIKGFVVTLSDAEDETKKLRVTFEHSVHAYRSTDESLRQKTIFDLNSHYDERFCSECRSQHIFGFGKLKEKPFLNKQTVVVVTI
jgi:hypothetical protein